MCYIWQALGIYSTYPAKNRCSIPDFEELPLPRRVVRDLASEQTAKIYVDSREIYGKLQEFIDEFMPSMQIV